MDKIKKCADCKWCGNISLDASSNLDSVDCLYPGTSIRKIREGASRFHLGLPRLPDQEIVDRLTCQYSRSMEIAESMFFDKGYCGPAALHFEPKEAALRATPWHLRVDRRLTSEKIDQG